MPDSLIRTLRECLKGKSLSEITTKEIAAKANTSQEMIRYYFGGKDGLILAMLAQSSENIGETMAALKLQMADCQCEPTRLLVSTIVGLYLSEQAATKIALQEYQKQQSPLREGYFHRSNIIIKDIHDVVVAMIERGIYRNDLDPRQLALSIMILAGHPVQLLWALSSEWLTLADMENGRWIDHVVAQIDSYCLTAEWRRNSIQ